MSNHADEYICLRTEIVGWIQIEYALLPLSAVAVATVITFLRPETSDVWPMQSGILLIMLSCLGIFTSFARSKILTLGAYIKVFHRTEGEWEDRYERYLRAYGRDVVLVSHRLALFLLYIILAITGIGYPYILHLVTKNQTYYPAYYVLVLGIFVFGFMLWTSWESYNKEICKKRWKDLRDHPDLGQTEEV